MRNVPIQILNAADNVTQTGSSVWCGQYAAACFIPVFGDASATGTVKIQGNNDEPIGAPPKFTPSSAGWADIPNATSAIASGVGAAIDSGSDAVIGWNSQLWGSGNDDLGRATCGLKYSSFAIPIKEFRSY